MSLISRKPEVATLQNCDDEPIRVPGAIQPHGVLLCIDCTSGSVSHVSANIEGYFGVPAEKVVGESIASVAQLFGGKLELAAALQGSMRSGTPTTVDDTGISDKDGRRCALRILPQGERIVLEILPVDETLYEPIDFGLIHSAASVLREIDNLEDVCAAAAKGFRTISGYDRVMVYHFHPDGSGEVLAEAAREDLPTYLGMRYPATDIPKQARQLYLENHVRIIPDIGYQPVDLLHREESLDPVDLGQAQLRSVSPMHVEYLQNMGVGATLTISIVVKGELVGLIACHHYSPKLLHHKLLILCEYFGQAFSLQYGNRMEAERNRRRQKLDTLRSKLAESVRSLPAAEVIAEEGDGFLELAEADGVAYCHRGWILRTGNLPVVKWIERFRVWAMNTIPEESQFVTENVAADLPEIEGDRGETAGILAVSLGDGWENCILWFRREVEQTVDWAGKPDKLDLENENRARLSPRKSFDLWRETIRGKCLPWEPLLLASVVNFARYDLALTIEMAEKNKSNALLEDLTAELQRSNGDLSSFAYAASHDLQEPLRAVAGCLQILDRRSGSKFNEEDRRLFNMAIDGARRMQRLVGDLLAYSRLNTVNTIEKPIDAEEEFKEAKLRLQDSIERKNAVVVLKGKLPVVCFSKSQLATVFQNLIGNAIKFHGNESPRVEITCEPESDGYCLFCVSDNGIGIGAEYLDDIFTIFSRLHTQYRYEGSGIGLAVCRKIIERHGGRIWVESEEGKGSRFWFRLREAEG